VPGINRDKVGHVGVGVTVEVRFQKEEVKSKMVYIPVWSEGKE
jgi:hypothetical protein